MEEQNGSENQNGKVLEWQTAMDDPSGLPQQTDHPAVTILQ